MIDFACKEFKVEDVIKCALTLTRADLRVLKYFLNAGPERRTDEGVPISLNSTPSPSSTYIPTSTSTPTSALWVDTETLSRALELDQSTVQRSVKKLYEKEILQRSQQNLESGGYVFIYQIRSKGEIKNIIMNIVRGWAEKLGKELEQWEKRG